jgi:inhibitor of cysteine peptidase
MGYTVRKPLLAAAVSLLAAGLCLGVAALPTPARADTPVTATDKDDKGKVTVAPGGTLVVRLESNVTTGYSWHVHKNDAKQLRLQGRPKYERPEGGAIGAGGHQVFTFKVAAPDNTDTTLELYYTQAGSRDPKPGKTFTLNVHVAK